MVIAVDDLDARAAEAVTGELPYVYQDPDVGVFGAINSLHSAGDTFVELLAQRDDGSAVGCHLDRLGGDGGYMVIIQVDDLAEHLALVEAAGIRTVFEAVVDGIRGVHLHPADVGGAILSLDEADPPNSWPWCGPSWTGGAPTTGAHPISSITLTATDPIATSARWASVLGVRADGPSIAFDRTRIDFVEADDRPDRLVGVTIPDLAAFDLGGVAFSQDLSR